MRKEKTAADEFLELPNIGPATAADLQRLGVTSIGKLKKCDPHELYDRLAKMDGKAHDICVLDVFHAIIHNAKTGDSKMWWEFSQMRKSQTAK